MGIDRHELEHRNWRPSAAHRPREREDIPELNVEDAPQTAPTAPDQKPRKSKADA